MKEYEQLKKEAIQGWNTWNTRSILSHVHMPDGFAIDLCLKDYRSSRYLKEADVGQAGADQEKVFPGAHAYDGSYTQLRLSWQNIELQVESAKAGDDLVLLVRCLKRPACMPLLIAETGILWNRPGKVYRQGACIIGEFENSEIRVFTTGKEAFEPYAITKSPYIAVELEDEVGFSTGTPRTVREIDEIIVGSRLRHQQNQKRFGELSEAYNAMQTCLAWDTVYDPLKDRIVSTVSRRWNKGWSGYVLFCWDNYFAALMAMPDSRAIAYSNAIEITKEKVEAGFVPNFAASMGASSRDRSQPPVGAMTVKQLYRKYREKWLVEMLFDDLFTWNTWWTEHRQIRPGLYAWGSDPYCPRTGHESEITGNNNHQGAAYESGLDNSPMFDDAGFSEETHLMEQIDVGLTGLFIMDCSALAELAQIIGREKEAVILKERCRAAEEALQLLWDDQDKMFYNFRTDIEKANKRISPTNFYSLNSAALTEEQVAGMLEHFYNPREFWGDYILPSIARNDPAYPEQDYWRGRIWAPMNFLVYIGLKNQHCDQAAKELADRSVKLILKEWLEKGHVHENYCGDTGEGCNKWNSDGFYHWGGLLALIGLMEAGFLDDPAKPLRAEQAKEELNNS